MKDKLLYFILFVVTLQSLIILGLQYATNKRQQRIETVLKLNEFFVIDQTSLDAANFDQSLDYGAIIELDSRNVVTEA